VTADLGKLNRKVLVTGHYGSGKTEFSVSLAMLAAEAELRWSRRALVDLDVANPYFRSRERRELLNASGVKVYDSIFSREITAELPALSAAIRAPLEDEDCFTVIDMGGDRAGARVVNQFAKYFKSDYSHIVIVNAFRPETRTVDGAHDYLRAIEAETQIPVTGIVGNSHLLRETDADTVRRGYELSRSLSEATGIPLLFTVYPAPLVSAAELAGIPDLFPAGMYMRPTWLDK